MWIYGLGFQDLDFEFRVQGCGVSRIYIYIYIYMGAMQMEVAALLDSRSRVVWLVGAHCLSMPGLGSIGLLISLLQSLN